MQNMSSQTPEGIVSNGEMLDGDRERQEENRGRQREEGRLSGEYQGHNAKRWPKSVGRIS